MVIIMGMGMSTDMSMRIIIEKADSRCTCAARFLWSRYIRDEVIFEAWMITLVWSSVPEIFRSRVPI